MRFWTPKIVLLTSAAFISIALSELVLYVQTPDWARFIYFPVFQFKSENLNYIFRNLFLLGACIVFLKLAGVGNYGRRLWNTFVHLRSPLPQHFIVLIVSVAGFWFALFSKDALQTAFFFSGDFLAVLLFAILVLSLISVQNSSLSATGLQTIAAEAATPVQPSGSNEEESNSPNVETIDALTQKFLSMKLGRPSMTVALLGAFGTGKTYLLRALAAKLKDLYSAKENQSFSTLKSTHLIYLDLARFTAPGTVFTQLHNTILGLLERDFVLPIQTKTSLFLAGAEIFGRESLLRPIERLLPRADPQQFYSQISSLITETKSRFLIILDDIDRLPLDEARHCFQVIRLLQTTNNIFTLVPCAPDYLIAYQSYLSGNANNDSSMDDVLNKHFDFYQFMPGLRPTQIQNDINSIVTEALATIPSDERKVAEGNWRGEAAYGHSGHEIGQPTSTDVIDLIWPLLQNPRRRDHFKVKLRAHVSRIRSDIFFPDLVILCAVEVAKPALLHRIREQRTSLLGLYYWRNLLAHNLPEYTARVDLFVQSLDHTERRLLRVLFPWTHRTEKLEQAKKLFKSHQDRAESLSRFCHPAFFSLYFQEINSNDNSRHAIDTERRNRIIQLADDPSVSAKSLSSHIEPLVDEGSEYKDLAWSWLRRTLRFRAEHISRKVLLAASHLRFSRSEHDWISNPIIESMTFIYSYWNRPDREFEIFLDIIKSENSDIYALAVFMNIVDSEGALKDDFPFQRLPEIYDSMIFRQESKIANDCEFIDEKSKEYMWHILVCWRLSECKLHRESKCSTYLLNQFKKTPDLAIEFIRDQIQSPIPIHTGDEDDPDFSDIHTWFTREALDELANLYKTASPEGYKLISMSVSHPKEEV
jgi:hypothetical protein